MKNDDRGLLLNHTFHPIDTLTALCNKKVKAEGVPQWERKVYQFILEWLSEKAYIVQRSSGTTGQPKAFHLPKRSMICSAQNTCNYFDLRTGQSALLCLPVDYIAGKMMVVRAFVGKLNLLLMQPSNTPVLSGLEEVDFCAMVPLQVSNLLNRAEPLHKIKKLIIGGAEIRPELEVTLRDLPVEVYATYGMAETCSQVAIRKLSGPQYGRYYNAMPGIKCSTDSRNCLVIESGYLDNRVVTNDVVELIDSHSFRWVGRYDNLINSGGIKVVPEEIEAVISKKTGMDCAIIGLPDSKLGQKVVLVLEKKDGKTGLNELKEMVKEEIPGHSQPKEIIFVEHIPRNHSFKVDRRRLVEQLWR